MSGLTLQEKFERICSQRGISCEVIEKALVERNLSVNTFVETYNKMSIEALDSIFYPEFKVKKKRKVVPVEKDYCVEFRGGAFGEDSLEFQQEFIRLRRSLSASKLAALDYFDFVRYPCHRFSSWVSVEFQVKAFSKEEAVALGRKLLVHVASLNIPFGFKRVSKGIVFFPIDDKVLIIVH
jgi:hypothetical protein